MRRSLFLYVLLAFTLLCSTTSWANQPERPTPLLEPKTPQGIELPEMTIPNHPTLPERTLVKKTFNKVTKAPRKAPMGDETVIAKIGEVGYTSLQAAFDAARLAGKQTTIDVIEAITESNELYIYGNSDVILNLNGKTITLSGTNSINISYDGIVVTPEEGEPYYSYQSSLEDKLTIVDNSQAKNGKIIGQGFPIYNYGTTTISDVTIESTDDGSTDYGYGVNNYALMTINSGHILGKFAGAYNEGTMYVKGGTIESTVEEDDYGYGLYNCGTIEITGGTVNGSGDYAVAILNKKEEGYPGKITVTNGSISGSYYAVWNDAEIAISNITLTGDVYNSSTSTNTSYTKCVIKGSPDIEGGITTIDDCSISNYLYILTGTVTLNNCVYSNYIYLPDKSTANVTIDGEKTNLNGNSLYVYNGLCTVKNGKFTKVSQYGGTLDIKGGTFQDGSTYYTIYVYAYYANATLNVYGGTIKSTYGTTEEYSYCAGAVYVIPASGKKAVANFYGGTILGLNEAVHNYNGTINVTRGTFSDDKTELLDGGFYINNGDGTYTAKHSVALIEGRFDEFETVQAAIDMAVDGNVVKLNVKDITEDIEISNKNIVFDIGENTLNGTLTATNATVIVEGREKASITTLVEGDGGDIQLKGGTYAFEPEAKYLAENYFVKEYSTGKYTVGTAVATIGSETYTSLAHAIETVPNDNTVTTITMQSNTEECEIKLKSGQNIVLDLNNKTISYTHSNKGKHLYIFDIVSGSQLTITDDATQQGVITYKYEGAKDYGSSYSTIYVHGGKLIVQNGIIKNETTSECIGYVIDFPNNSGSLTINDGALRLEGVCTGGSRAIVRMWGDDICTINGGDFYTVDVMIHIHGGKTNLTINDGTFTLDESLLNDGYIHALVRIFGTEATKPEAKVIINNCTTNALAFQAQNTWVKFDFETVHQDWNLVYSENVQIKGGKYKDNFVYVGGYVKDEGGELVPKTFKEKLAFVLPVGYKVVDLNDGYYTVVPAEYIYSNDENVKWSEVTAWDEDHQAKDEIPSNQMIAHINHNMEVDISGEAYRVEVGEKGNLTITSGNHLYVGDGGLHVEDGGQIIIEAGAVLTDGYKGVISDDYSKIIINSNEREQGVFMIAPDASIHTSPSATVSLTTKCKQIAGSPKYEYIWQRFAIPTKDGKATRYTDNHEAISSELYTGESNYVDAIYGWDNNKEDWYMLKSWTEMEPLKGYQLTNNTKNGGVTYTFEGDLIGNHDGDYNFDYEGFHFFGNSYTAPIYIASFLESVQKANNGVDLGVLIYDVDADNFKLVTPTQAKFGLVTYKNGKAIKEIRSMQAFIMYGPQDATSTVNYESAIWGNPRFNGKLTNNAPARVEEIDMDVVTIKIEAANGQADEVTLMQSNDFTNAFDNGADGRKFIYANGINLYANTNIGQMTCVASDDVANTILGFRAGRSNSYTISFDNLYGQEFTLLDLATNTEIEMTEGATYTFTQEANTTNEARFMIIKRNGVATDLDDMGMNGNSVIKVIDNGQLQVIKNGTRYNVVGAEL